MKGAILESLVAAGMSAAEGEPKRELFERAERVLASLRGEVPGEPRRWFVPGRIEVFGKHTDYAGGRSLLGALERGLCVAAAPREDNLLRVADAQSGLTVEIGLGRADEEKRAAADWTLYVRTVARRLARNFPGALAGVDLAVASDLPRAAGLASSSALLTAIFTAVAERNRLAAHPAYCRAIASPAELAGYLGAMENGRDFGPLAGEAGVGTFGGSEDHTAILCCRAGCLSQFSFCPVRAERVVRLPEDWAFVVGVSGVVAEKKGGAREAYNRAALAAEAILELWQTATQRSDASLAAAVGSGPDAASRLRHLLGRAAHPAFSTEQLLERFEQFYEESEVLVREAAEAIARGDMAALARLTERSQAGAKRGLGNQVAETIALARQARELGAAAAAFGAGFGGSVWALAPRGGASAFCAEWARGYREKFPGRAATCEFFISGAGPGLTRLS